MAAITLWRFLPGAVTIALLILAYLHWRFDLSDYGIRSRGAAGDLLAIGFIGILGLVPVLARSSPHAFTWEPAFSVAIERWFTNPAASVENFFYFGFITERLSDRTGRWLTPLLVGLMYTAHEMSNPEYWYKGVNFGLIFVGVMIWARVYLWRRSAVTIWLGDGVYRFVGRLFG